MGFRRRRDAGLLSRAFLSETSAEHSNEHTNRPVAGTTGSLVFHPTCSKPPSGAVCERAQPYSPPPTISGATGFRRRLDRVRRGALIPRSGSGDRGIRGRPATSPQTSRKDRPTMPRPHRIAHRLLIAVLAIVGLVVPLTGSGLADASPSHHSGPKPTIVLVHGDWADGSSWNAVIAKTPSPRLHRRRPAQPVARPDRCPVPGGLPRVGARADRAGRAFLRGLRHHQRGDRQHQRQGAGLHRRLHPRRG